MPTFVYVVYETDAANLDRAAAVFFDFGAAMGQRDIFVAAATAANNGKTYRVEQWNIASVLDPSTQSVVG